MAFVCKKVKEIGEVGVSGAAVPGYNPGTVLWSDCVVSFLD